jgi:transposase
LTGVVWVIALFVFWMSPQIGSVAVGYEPDVPLLASVVTCDRAQQRGYFPWQAQWRWRKLAWQQYQRWRQAHQRAKWLARLSWLLVTGAMGLATVIDWLTRSQLQRQLGALPVLYALLEGLQVRSIINRHCPTAAQIDHGTVALVMVLNRLMAPRPLSKIADWLAETVLVQHLGLAAAKFNDDRLGRSLDALSQCYELIWQELIDQALRHHQLDLSLIFYDLSAYILHGQYAKSDLADFGFAHNTPMNKQKLKTGLSVGGDGNIPLLYQPWSGRTADKATVQANLERLGQLLRRQGWPVQQTLLVGDKATLDDALAVAYDKQQIRYLAALPALRKTVCEQLLAQPSCHFYRYPLTPQPRPQQCWGIACPITFEHEAQQVTHQGLVILSQPMATALRQSRARQLRELRQELQTVRAKIGQPHYRTQAALQRSVRARLKASPVGHFLAVEVYLTEPGQLDLRWQVDRYLLWQAMERDGRYLLVTNDLRLTPTQMVSLYRRKDGVEKCFQITKSDFHLSPLYVHRDSRIQGLLLINMIALLAYTLLERQVRQAGWTLTTRRLIERLDNLRLIETTYRDGSCQRRLTPLSAEQAALLTTLAHLLPTLNWPHWFTALGLPQPLPLLSPNPSLAPRC